MGHFWSWWWFPKSTSGTNKGYKGYKKKASKTEVQSRSATASLLIENMIENYQYMK